MQVAALSGFMPFEVAHASDARYQHWQSKVRACQSEGGGFATATCKALMFSDASASPALLDLVCGMLHPDASRRFTLEQVASHAWFAEQ